MTVASNNDFPSILLTEQGSAPASPAASHQRLYIRTSDHTLVTVNSSGTVAPVSSGATSVAAHGCRVHRASSNVTVGNNTYTSVAFDAEDYDTDTMHDNTTNNSRLTIPTISGVTTGLWAMKAWGYTDVTTGRVNAQFKLNGTTVIGWSEQLASSGVIGPFHASTDYVLTASDYVELQVRTVSGAGNAVFDSGASPYFMIAFLGKVT